MSAPRERFKSAIAEYLPPVRDRRFWITQALVLAVFIGHEIVHANLGGISDALAAIPYAFPLLYAALVFALPGSVATMGLVLLLLLPYVISDALSGQLTDLVAHIVELSVLVVVVPVVGIVVGAERRARQAHEAAELHYRALFQASGVPAVVLADDGRILEANPAADALIPGSFEGRFLRDVLGEEAAAAVLTGDGASTIRVSAELELRPIVSRAQSGTGGLIQVLFQDVTEELAGRRQTRAWALAVLVAQEEERQRIAHELHDDAIQLVVALRRAVEHTVKAVPAAEAELAPATTIADQLLTGLRAVAVRLRPPDLDDLGLASSFERLVSEARQRGMVADLKFDETGRRPAPEVALALYRVGQEALTNTERHAHANRISLGLSFSSDQIKLTIEDDGIGFTAERSKEDESEGAHLGLVGMRERLGLVGGSLEVRSAPGAGTTIVAVAPLSLTGPGSVTTRNMSSRPAKRG